MFISSNKQLASGFVWLFYYLLCSLLIRPATPGPADQSPAPPWTSPTPTGSTQLRRAWSEIAEYSWPVLITYFITDQVQMVQSRGSRGVRLTGTTTSALSFPASQIFTNCDYFPAEFSLVATLKIPRLRQVKQTGTGLVWSNVNPNDLAL